MKRNLLIVGLLMFGIHETTASQIIPRPRIEKLTGDTLTLAAISVSGNPPAEGLRLLEARLKALGCSIRNDKKAMIVFEKCPAKEMAQLIVKEALEPKRLAQAYRLTITDRVTIKAPGDLGLSYGIVSLVQLLESDSKGNVRVPKGEILDWPEIGLRLSKTSATDNNPARVNRFAAWMPLYKMSHVGLQFHGKKSLELDDNFTANVKTVCGWARRNGVCETVVYFCPFRGKPGTDAYDFRLSEHKAAYAKLLQSFLAQGAHGVEVDYNDWPGSAETPIEDVINLACDAVWKSDPGAYIFYCPPNKGTSTYRGPASPEMTRILSKVPARVWPLWTGYATLITKPLTVETVEAWTKAAGRRPLLWVNRVALGVKGEFGRAVAEASGAHAFRGDLLPKNLNQLFEGVHFNAGMDAGYVTLHSEKFSTEALAYFATAADYVWNPHDWDAVESCRRARRFVEIMLPLLEQSSSLMKMQIAELAPSGAWCWFQDPRAMYYEGKHRRTYVGWITLAGDVQVASIDADTGETLTSTLRGKLQADDHDNPVIHITPDGHLTVFYSKHGPGDGIFYRRSAEPESIQQWEPEQIIRTNTKGRSGFTYYHPMRLSAEGGKTYLFWRGGNWKPTFSTTMDGKTWTEARNLLMSNEPRPYMKVCSNGRDSIHFAYTSGDPKPEETKVTSLFYAFYRKGTLHRADGSRICALDEVPFDHKQGDRLWDHEATGHRAWVWDIALDADENPVVVFVTYPDTEDHRYQYARWDGKKWNVHEVTRSPGGFTLPRPDGTRTSPRYSGGITLNHSDPSTVYVSAKREGVFEIEKWTTPDHGKTWMSEAVTSGSKKNNVRPVVPWGFNGKGVEVFWMHGDYYYWKADYHTAIQMRFGQR